MTEVVDVADQWNHYMNEAVNNAPEPLQKLGEYLANLLDEDQWKTAERYLNAAVLALIANLAAKDARLAVMREAMEYCANAPLSGWTIAQGVARAALADQPTGDE